MYTIKERIEKNGYAIIEDFLTQNQILELKLAGKKLCEEALKEKKLSTFNASTESKPQDVDQNFIDSANKVGYFFEKHSLNENGQFKVNPLNALNKVGHALHRHIPTFRTITFNQNVVNVCRNLCLQKPAIIQTMYIYKNPRIGGCVPAHLDATYLYTKPSSLYGFWIALDDATVNNGCLWFVPGSHKDIKTHSRFIRNPDKNSKTLCIMEGSDFVYDESKFVAAPVPKGSCIIIHGNVVHRSDSNLSEKSRHAYTFHVYDCAISQYSAENWLQAEFETLY